MTKLNDAEPSDLDDPLLAPVVRLLATVAVFGTVAPWGVAASMAWDPAPPPEWMYPAALGAAEWCGATVAGGLLLGVLGGLTYGARASLRQARATAAMLEAQRRRQASLTRAFWRGQTGRQR